MNNEEVELEMRALVQSYELIAPLYPSQRMRVLLWLQSRVADMNKSKEERIREHELNIRTLETSLELERICLRDLREGEE